MDRELLTEKYNLIKSGQYKRIRELQLDNILTLSCGSIEPLILKGMLKTIRDTDLWEQEYLKEKNKKE